MSQWIYRKKEIGDTQKGLILKYLSSDFVQYRIWLSAFLIVLFDTIRVTSGIIRNPDVEMSVTLIVPEPLKYAMHFEDSWKYILISVKLEWKFSFVLRQFRLISDLAILSG